MRAIQSQYEGTIKASLLLELRIANDPVLTRPSPGWQASIRPSLHALARTAVLTARRTSKPMIQPPALAKHAQARLTFSINIGSSFLPEKLTLPSSLGSWSR